jgi:uncharacterized membrane protein
MEQLKGLPLGRQIVLGAGVLLLIDSFLDWQQVSFLGHSAGQTAWHGFLGVVMCLALVVLLAWTAAKAFGVELPVNVPDGLTSLGLSALILLFALLKAITDDYVHWPAWAGVVLAAGIAYGAWLVFQASGESLPSMTTTGGGGGQAPPPEAPPSEPQQPADV